MPWHWEPMKDVISCDKLPELQISIIGRFLNEETHLVHTQVQYTEI